MIFSYFRLPTRKPILADERNLTKSAYQIQHDQFSNRFEAVQAFNVKGIVMGEILEGCLSDC